MRLPRPIALLVALLPSLAAAQSSDGAIQFFDSNFTNSSTSLSAACVSALQATVNCPTTLLNVPDNSYIFTADEVTALCNSTCADSQSSYRAQVATACASDTWLDPVEGFSMAIVELVNSFFSGYSTNCLSDRLVWVITSPGHFTYPLVVVLFSLHLFICGFEGRYPLLSFESFLTVCSTGQSCYMWLYGGVSNGTTTDTSDGNNDDETGDCSECSLSMLQAQMEDPWAYNDGLDEYFSSLTSSCGVTTYSVTTPTATLYLNS
jgi:hypothetical protein